MLTAVTSGMATVWNACGSFLSALTTTEGELSAALPMFALGISISLALLGVRIVRSLFWAG